ncbi:MAG: sugar-transfer associated ATP-grasp domain-containing protein [Synergistaceae bacterium]|nr:sugar-transfer associated ATP-grasp domain-containing protein [Synergistaceae bacterium]
MCSIKTMLGEEKYRRIKNNIKLKYQRKWIMMIYRDAKRNKTCSAGQKIWAYRHGFLSRRIDQVGLNSKNLSRFLSDYDYMRLFPINGKFVFWIDDKLTTKYVLSKYSDCMPEYYFHLLKGNPNKILKLMDCPDGLSSDIGSILKLLKAKEQLALKPVSGAFGSGFTKLGFKSLRYTVNDKEIDENGICELLLSKNGFIITEYVEMHEELKRIYPCSLNTIRLKVVNENGDDPFIGEGAIKFGTKRSGFVDNISSGGISCWINIKTGYFNGGFEITKNKEFLKHTVHPDTGMRLEGIMPNWQLLQDGILKICRHIPQIEYMGFDVAVTADGFKIIEINSAQGLNRTTNEWDERLRGYFSRLLKRKGIRSQNGF